MRRVLVAIGVAVLVSACGASGSPLSYTPKVDSPTLRALKAAAHIEPCPATTAPPTGGLPHATVPCLGGGRSVTLASLRGPMVLNLWAQNCAPCRTEMPVIEQFAKKYAGRVPVLGVDYYQDQPDLALAFAKSVGATYPMVADYAPVIRTAVLPTTILLDARGRIVYEQPVAISSEAQLEHLVRRYLGVT